jgi:urea transport system substrate-binding protein
MVASLHRGRTAKRACSGFALALCLGALPLASEAAVAKVGVAVSLSGPGTATSDGALKGIQLATDEINVHGARVELIVVDDATDPKTANDVCGRLVLKDKVQAIIGVEPTPARLACNQHAMKAGIPYVAASSSPGDICLPNLFHTGHVSRQMTVPLVDLALAQGLRRIYFIGTDYAAPKSALEVVKQRAEPKGAQVVGSAFASLGTSDFAAELSKIAAAKPDIVFTSFPNADGFTFHRQFGSDPRLQGIKRADTFMTAGMAKSLGNSGQGVYVAIGYMLDVPGDANKAFKEAFMRKFGATAVPDIWALNAYNGMHLLAAALQKGESGPAVLNAMRVARFDGPSGSVEMSDLYAKTATFVGQTREDGRIELLPQFTVSLSPGVTCQAR